MYDPGMSTDPGRREARRRYVKALDDLRRARQRFVDARVPMDLTDREPPRWTPEQHAAVTTYTNAWAWFLGANESYWQEREKG